MKVNNFHFAGNFVFQYNKKGKFVKLLEMKNNNNVISKYDKEGRVISTFGVVFNMLWTYKYNKTGRVTEIRNPKNTSNYKTTIIEKLIGKKYIPVKKTEYGDVYTITIHYDNDGKEIKVTRKNKLQKTSFVVETFRDNRGKPLIWIEDYNGDKNIGFSITNEKIKEIKKSLK